MDSKKQKHWNLLTNTLALWRNHIDAKNKQCTAHKLIQQIESWRTSHGLVHDKAEYEASWRPGSARSFERKNVNIQLYRQKGFMNAWSALRVKWTSCAPFWHSQAFIFLMIKVRSCKIRGKFSTGSFLWIAPPAPALNELDVWNFFKRHPPSLTHTFH